MKIDLHVHSKFSQRPAEWILQKLDSPESFTEPLDLYRTAMGRGMSHVTITDHNCIDGCLEIADQPHTFLSEEVTTYFPDDKCKLHVLVYDITEDQHLQIQRARPNVFDLVAYLESERIVHALAHPLYSINGKLNVEHFEKALLLFNILELNGARSGEQNACLQALLAGLTPETMADLADTHGIEPVCEEPWKKSLIAGSDDHSSLCIATHHTEVNGALTLSDFFHGVKEGRGRVMGTASTPKGLAHNIYSIAYQYYYGRFNLHRYAHSDTIFTMLDRFLKKEGKGQPRRFSRLNLFLDQRRSRKNPGSGVLNLFKSEAYKLIGEDPQLSEIFKNGSNGRGDASRKWFSFVNKVSNQVLCRFADHIVDSLSGAQSLNLFNSLGSAGALYAVLAPYFVAYSIFSRDRQFARTVTKRFSNETSRVSGSGKRIRVAHFTDTLHEINGVALTLKKQAHMAQRTGKVYTLITCDASHRANGNGIMNFHPIRAYELPMYPEQKLYYPPFLEMLDFCYDQGFTHIHSATPGPLGLAALAAARILSLPLVGTYHTAIPQYAEYLTRDDSVGSLVWRYIVWYYDQMTNVLVPSQSTADELAHKGVDPAKIKIFPRGVETDLFHPSRKNGCLEKICNGSNGKRLLYVGRVSREKNLPLLVDVFRDLIRADTGIQLIVVGDGPYRDEMQRETEGMPVVFTGYRHGEELASIYASADLFVFPSTTDTFGNVVLESQAAGTPVVVADLGGPRENMVPGRTGLVVKGNDAKDLFHALTTLLGDPSRLTEMGKAARAYAEGRSFHTAFEEAWDLYEETSTAC